jgi:serine protease Do
MSSIEEIGRSIAAVADRAGPSIVGVGRDGRGSGVVVADGLVLTNAHNLRGREVTITFSDGRSDRGEVRGVDPDGDLAVIAIDTSGATAIDWASGDGAKVGDAVFGAAATYGGGSRVTMGFVSSVARSFRGPGGRRISGSIEHTAPLARGSSGGPIVNRAGQFLGLNTNRLGEGFYLAQAADAELRTRVDRLGRGESPSKARLGVGIAPGREARRLRRAVGLPDRDGLLVRLVEDDSPAARAGIRAGDLLVSAGDQPLRSADDLFEALDALEDGATLRLTVVRGAEELTVSVTFADAATSEEGTA